MGAAASGVRDQARFTHTLGETRSGVGVRGLVWAYYSSDDGNIYALQVDADYAAMPERGWTYPAAAGTTIYPRGWVPRYVVGLDATGRKRTASVANVGAPLWTGAASSFTINGSDELAHTVTVTKLRSERRGRRPR